MHRSKIEWVDDTWNPITGCLERCRYCYAKKRSGRFSGDIRKNMNSPLYEKEKVLQVLNGPFMSETGGILNYPFGFLPTYHQHRLDYPSQRKNGCNILIGEMGETFGDWIPDEILIKIFGSCLKQDIHNYLFLTRFPGRYQKLCSKGILPIGENYWYGSTITCNEDPIPSLPPAVNTFVCIEPMLEAITMPSDGSRIADWIIIGAETGPGKYKVIPEKQWIEDIVEYADRTGIPIFMKSSLLNVMALGELRQDFPELLTKKEISPLERARREVDCTICGMHGQKKDMVVLAARSRRGEMPKQLCHVCQDCFRQFCNSYNIKIPELEGLKDEKTELSQDNGRIEDTRESR